MNLRICSLSLILATLCLCVSCRQEEIFKAEIIGSSMAPSLNSQHASINCEHCQYTWDCEPADSSSTPVQVICPNCGAEVSSSALSRPADVIEVVANRSVKRWDMVACKLGDRLLVKRVLGLPGERVNFQDGDLFIDGERITKPDPIQSTLSQTVFDSSFLDQKDLQQRLQPRESKRDTRDDLALNLFDYQQWRCYSTADADRRQPTPVEDNYGFNTSLRRNLHTVNDLMVDIDLTFAKQSSYAFEIHRHIPGVTLRVRCVSSGGQSSTVLCQMRVEANGESALTENTVVAKYAGQLTVGLQNVDGRIRFTIDDQSVFEQKLPPSAGDQPLPFLSLGMPEDASVTLRRLKISRDIYFFQPEVRPSLQLPLTLAADEYYVVGDNLPVSDDSRLIGPVKEIIGVVRKKPAPLHTAR